MGKSIHGMRARSRDRARAHHNGRVSSRLFLAGCSPAEPASASPADATLRLHPPQCQRNFIERYFVTVLVVSAQGSTASSSVSMVCVSVFMANPLFLAPNKTLATATRPVCSRAFMSIRVSRLLENRERAGSLQSCNKGVIELHQLTCMISVM